jgi:hypothetical protein
MRQTAPGPGAHAGLRRGRGATSVRHLRTPSIKVVLFTVLIAVLGGLVGVAVSREVAPAGQDTAAARLALPTPRPPRASAEQSYLEALWPIHTTLERAAVRVALGASFYKLQDITRAELRTRLDDALAAYKSADQRLRLLRPPGTLQDRHQAYLTAVELFEQSTLEMLRMYDDGSDQHLYAGFPLSMQGTDRIREVGQEFWPDEYPPN